MTAATLAADRTAHLMQNSAINNLSINSCTSVLSRQRCDWSESSHMSCTVENDNNFRPIVNEKFTERVKGLRVGGDSECKVREVIFGRSQRALSCMAGN